MKNNNNNNNHYCHQAKMQLTIDIEYSARNDHRKTKEFTYNYVDRVRLAESSLQDHKCPTRGSGWRHNKSISHLDLATSCHSAASGLNHWSQSRQLRHSRSLDYNQIDDRCRDALDIAEFYWRIDPEAEENYEDVPLSDQRSGLKHSSTSNNNNNNNNEQQHYRDYNYADENYHSTNSIYQQQQQQHSGATATTTGAIPPVLQAFDFGSESCSLRRSRSLAVIREETFSDLQITSANSSRRRSQLIPRARLVNRGYFRERERLITCGNNKHHHHHHNTSRVEKLTNGSGGGAEQDAHSNGSGATTCDSHQHRHHHHHHDSGSGSGGHHQSRESDNYYDNLKRLDALAVGLAEQLHPWHSDKSDLESLNSDYFKNSLHQSHELKQQLDLEALEQAVNLLTSEKPRIYQSRRQQRGSHNERQHNSTQHKLHAATAAVTVTCGPDSCPENSQSSLFPETTTSNSDDQTDSPSLSEQEYDITKIEEIFQQTHLEGDEESYELISLTTTTRTRIETTEDEEEADHEDEDAQLVSDQQLLLLVEEEELGGDSNEHTTTDTEVEGTLKRSKALSENLEKLIAYDSVYLSSEEGSESTLVDDNCEAAYEERTLRTEDVNVDETSTLLHISIEDTIYEKLHQTEKEPEQSQSTSLLERKEETVQVVKDSLHTKLEYLEQQTDQVTITEPILYTQILRVEHTPTTSSITTATPAGVTSSAASKPKILSVVEKRKLKRYSDATYSASESNTQRAALEHLAIAHGYQPTTDNPFAHLKRQATDSLYVPFTAHLGENQYHSLPDINIGQSLKVSECIDAKLRSSYHLNQYQRTDDEVVANIENRLNENQTTKTSTKTLIHENHNNSSTSKSKQSEAVVTTEEIYDSIKRFGRAHQKARQKEYQELNEVIEKEKEKKKEVVRDKRTKVDTSECEVPKVCSKPARKTISQIDTTVEQEIAAPAEPTCQAEVDANEEDNLPVTQYLADDIVFINTKAAEISHATDDNEYRENPKEAPSIEVANFSKQIERRAKEIKDSARQTKRNKLEQLLESTTFTTATFHINKSTHNFPQAAAETAAAANIATPPAVVPSQSGTNQFRIIVTDTQNNIIEEDSIDGNCGESLTSAEVEAETVRKDPTLTASIKERKEAEIRAAKEEQGKGNLIKSTSLSFEQRKEKHKDKSIIVSSHNRVTSLKRVPSKPKRQQYPHQHGCQHMNNKSNDTNYCELFSSKSKERRVLSTQIYKARPAKVLATTTDSLRRTTSATGSKMSRPQILHVVDNKRKSDIVDSGAVTDIINNAKFEGDQVENEYLKKVDAVRCYWSKMAKDEQEKQNEPTHQDYSSETVNDKEPHQHQQQEQQQKPREFILGPQESSAKTTTEMPKRRDPSQDDFCSFMPSIEIVELDGEKKATIVSAVLQNSNSTDTLSNDASEPQFDHIRYKVLKSQQLIRSNVLARNKKEAQFDGLIQYLQDYSFQELLTNNNVVIVEPVRTKIERPMMTNNAAPTTTTSKNANAMKLGQGTSSGSAITAISQENYGKSKEHKKKMSSGAIAAGKLCSTGGIKRHFFYQPVRVNRELYEEELPNPDTVRNVRKFFEKHILPTPGQGLVVRSGQLNETAQSAEEEDERNPPPLQDSQATNVQQSPKSRRVRKYRYLTIDTSYGHAPQKQQHSEPDVAAAQRIAAHSRKWDTASLSSGISSGDLSSPCECNDIDATNNKTTNTESVATVTAAELKGVHVQDVVRQHNNKNNAVFQSSSSSAAMDVDGEVVRTIRVPRPRSAIYGPSGDSSYYRDIYEYNAGQRYCAQHHRIDDGEEDVDDNDLFADDDDDNDELCESYYVSNAVLEKIRECGSSVTYYGGRVLQSSNSPDPLLCCNNNGQLGNPNNALPHSTMTLTRARAREIETCSVCQPNECPHTKKLQQKFVPRGSNYSEELPQKQMPKEETDNNKDAYLGIKFKLVKSNSCSSRLELAGAGEVVYEDEDTELVRKMVHHFETSKNHAGAEACDELLTINSQIPARRALEGQSSVRISNGLTTKPVTVNNHINVPVVGGEVPKETLGANTKMHKSENNDTDVAGDKAETDVAAHTQITFQSSAMDIRLDTNNGGGVGSGTPKVCRNKNVDLAFTMTKQQQQQQQTGKPTGTIKEPAKNQLAQFPSLIDGGNQSETTHKKEKQQQQQKTVVTNGTTSVSVTSVTKSLECNLPSKEGDKAAKRITVPTVSQNPKKSLGNTTAAAAAVEKEKKVIPAMTPPTQIIVPVEIHRADVTKKEDTTTTTTTRQSDTVERHSLSTTSSAASLIDKTVVRHYVANDKSLFEKRKYDEIEFEEFEVYDPTKDFEKIIQSERESGGGGDNATAATSGNQQQPPPPRQMQLKHLSSSKSKSPSVSDLSSLNDEEDNLKEHRDGVDGDAKSKAETDCYDSLDDKL